MGFFSKKEVNVSIEELEGQGLNLKTIDFIADYKGEKLDMDSKKYHQHPDSFLDELMND